MPQLSSLFILVLKALVLFTITQPCFAQIDSLYIAPYEKQNAVSVYFGKNYLSLNRSINSNDEIEYIPNNPFTVGLGVTVANTIIDVSFGHGFQFLSEKENGKTKSFDFQLHHNARKFMVDLFIQNYKGFYTEDDRGENTNLYPDLKISQYGLHADYVFNHEKFSTKAAFNQSERQLKSVGSFLLGGGAYLTKIETDSIPLPNNRTSLSNFQLGISGGYSYTWVINNHWSLSGSVSVGMNIGNDQSGIFGKEKLEIYPTVLPRVAVGYATDLWSLRLSSINNMIFSNYSESENSNMSLISGNFQVTYIRRLDHFPFFRKK